MARGSGIAAGSLAQGVPPALAATARQWYAMIMPSAVESAVDTYVRAWSEPDSAVRAQMLEACFAADGRIVARNSEIRGRAALAEFMTRFLAEPTLLGVRVTSAIDAGGTTFRYRSSIDRRDGTSREFLDAGEIDASGRIALLLVFSGRLGEPA